MRSPTLLTVLLLLASAGMQPSRAAVELAGLSRTTERAVRANLALQAEPCTAAPARVQRLFRRSEREIRTALEVYGYFAPVIRKGLTTEGSCWQASFTVDRGPRVRLRTIDVRIEPDAEADPALRQLAGRVPFVAGKGLNQRDYDEYKGSILALAQQRGYFEGRFRAARIDIYPGELAADITLDYMAGPRYRFGAVAFEQAVVRDRTARSFIEFRAGDPYDAARINDLYTSLLVSGFFEGVEIRTTPRATPDRVVDVNVALAPSDPRTWTAGLGFATDTGPKVRTSFLHQRLNDRGHQFEATAEWSPVIGGITTSYRVPAGNPREEWLSFDLGYQYEETSQNDSDQYRVGLRRTKRRWDDWIETRSVNYRRETFNAGADSGTSNLVLPGISLATQPRVVASRPRSGYWLFLQASGTDQLLGSDTAFLQLETRAKLLLPLWSSARLITRGELGYTFKDRFSDLPFSVRYFAGGDSSVRGYDYKTLGPRDESGQVVGGSGKLVGSIEIDQRILANWSIAAFIDTGNAFDDWDSLGMKTGVGGGLRWYSPLGPIRVDVGVPLDKDAPDDWRIHVTLGPDL
jgi:translocation and assembly module TamA